MRTKCLLPSRVLPAPQALDKLLALQLEEQARILQATKGAHVSALGDASLRCFGYVQTLLLAGLALATQQLRAEAML